VSPRVKLVIRAAALLLVAVALHLAQLLIPLLTLAGAAFAAYLVVRACLPVEAGHLLPPAPPPPDLAQPVSSQQARLGEALAAAGRLPPWATAQPDVVAALAALPTRALPKDQADIEDLATRLVEAIGP
jgi:hypothetical protein